MRISSCAGSVSCHCGDLALESYNLKSCTHKRLQGTRSNRKISIPFAYADFPVCLVPLSSVFISIMYISSPFPIDPRSSRQSAVTS